MCQVVMCKVVMTTSEALMRMHQEGGYFSVLSRYPPWFCNTVRLAVGFREEMNVIMVNRRGVTDYSETVYSEALGPGAVSTRHLGSNV